MKPMDLLAFKVVIEPDEDLWQSYYPAWEHLGAATFGNTPEAAAANIKEVLEMIVEEIEEGGIVWPITPCETWEFSKPSIQDEPELIQLNCAPEHPDAIASHGGLPVFNSDSDVHHPQAYRLIYVAMEDVLASIHERRTRRETRTGGLTSRIFPPEEREYPINGDAQFGYVSRGAAISGEPREQSGTSASSRR